MKTSFVATFFLNFLFVLTCLVGGIGSVVIFRLFGEKLFWVFLFLAVFLGAIYIVICALNPSNPNVKCPRCRQQSLVPIVLGTPTGVRCTLCRYEDPSHSTHYLVPLKEVSK